MYRFYYYYFKTLLQCDTGQYNTRRFPGYCKYLPSPHSTAPYAPAAHCRLSPPRM